MSLVSLLVLTYGVTMLLVLCPLQNNTQAAETTPTNIIPAPNADVGKLLLLINEHKANSSLKGVKNIDLKIDRHGKAKEVIVNGKPDASSKSIEQRIRGYAFSNKSGSLKERKIRLVFKG